VTAFHWEGGAGGGGAGFGVGFFRRAAGGRGDAVRGLGAP